jgi:hypothetical protein
MGAQRCRAQGINRGQFEPTRALEHGRPSVSEELLVQLTEGGAGAATSRTGRGALGDRLEGTAGELGGRGPVQRV